MKVAYQAVKYLNFSISILLLLASAASVASGQNTTTPGELRTYSTLHSIGIEWELEGDADHDAVCQIQYRLKGPDTWKQALPLFRVDYFGWYADTKADRRYNMFAGSILFLQPSTTYEVRLELSDPDGGAETKMLSIATRPRPRLPEGGRTLHVVPGSGGGDGSEGNPFKRLSAAQSAAQPGDILLIHGGDYGSFTFDKPGAPGRYIVWKQAGDGEVVFGTTEISANHLWLEGLSFKSQSGGNGLRARVAPMDVVVSRNSFMGFHYSIFLSPQSQDWYIADNVVMGDNDPITGGIDGEGVELNHSSGHVVAYNRISRTADGVSYPGRNCDIYGNDIFDVSDDGLEPDYGYANNRMWGNRITNYKNNALSFQPMYCGPWYFIRNQVIGPGYVFKFRVQDRFSLAHNTFVTWGLFSDYTHHILSSLSRNNLYISASGKSRKTPLWLALYYKNTNPDYVLPPNYEPNWMTDVDYDGFDWDGAEPPFIWRNGSQPFTELRSLAEAVGIERMDRVFHINFFILSI